MTLRLNLGQYLRQHQITAYRLVNEVRGRVAPNTVYSLARRPAQRIDLRTVGELLGALERLTGQKVEIADMLEQQPEADLSHLKLPAGTPAYDPAKAKRFRYSGHTFKVKEGGLSAEQLIAEDRGRTLP